MPELPEVEVVRRGVAAHVVGRTIRRATVSGSRVARRHEAGPADLAIRLAGSTVLHADRRGKYLWLVVRPAGGEPEALVVHLGMSGQLLVSPPEAELARHTHAILDFDDEGSTLRFVDQRTFGGWSLRPLVPDPHAPGPSVAAEPRHPYGIASSVLHIAPDLLEPAFDTAGVVRALKARRTVIKRALLDQGLVSGIGNIYADEALWRARVHGRRECGALTKPALGRLLGHARAVMSEALDVGGTSFDALYVNVNGASGYFDRSLNAYGQAGRACARCQATVLREEFMNRSSFFCPRCQPRPRAHRRGP
ncbi:MAG: bifunctional DNA-formamidopyrimidine glycosylase/DNA-(apurinic or apyrimidinic site) lyase [Ornithinimicrobium sp.]